MAGHDRPGPAIAGHGRPCCRPCCRPQPAMAGHGRPWPAMAGQGFFLRKKPPKRFGGSAPNLLTPASAMSIQNETLKTSFLNLKNRVSGFWVRVSFWGPRHKQAGWYRRTAMQGTEVRYCTAVPSVTSPWPALAGHCRPWPAMSGHGRPWPAMAGLGRPWPAMAGHGRPWPALAGHGRCRVMGPPSPYHPTLCCSLNSLSWIGADFLILARASEQGP